MMSYYYYTILLPTSHHVFLTLFSGALLSFVYFLSSFFSYLIVKKVLTVFKFCFTNKMGFYM